MRKAKSLTVSNSFKMYNPIMQNYGYIQAINSYLPDYQGSRSISLVAFTMRCRFSVDPEFRKIHLHEQNMYDVEHIQLKMNESYVLIKKESSLKY